MWAICKREYRSSIDKLKVANLPYDNEGLVRTIVDNLSDDTARRLAAKAIPATRVGQPIEVLPNERRANDRQSIVLFSPQPKFLDYVEYEEPGAESHLLEREEDPEDLQEVDGMNYD